MDQNNVATRYAKAFFELAREKGLLEPLKEDMEALRLLSEQSSEFRHTLVSPVLKTSQKINLLDLVLEGKIRNESLELIRTLVRNKREANLPAVSANFLAMYRKNKGIETAVLTSAVPLSAQLTAQIAGMLEKEFGSAVEMKLQTDPALIGGFVLRVGDRQIDTSVQNELKKIRQTLLKTNIK